MPLSSLPPWHAGPQAYDSCPCTACRAVACNDRSAPRGSICNGQEGRVRKGEALVHLFVPVGRYVRADGRGGAGSCRTEYAWDMHTQRQAWFSLSSRCLCLCCLLSRVPCLIIVQPGTAAGRDGLPAPHLRPESNSSGSLARAPAILQNTWEAIGYIHGAALQGLVRTW